MDNQNLQDMVKELKITALATDPIYIGTGGYTIGRVDNTIVRDPITRLPKIPGSSLAGTWRYYVALELQSWLKEEINGKSNEIISAYNSKIDEIQDEKIEDCDKEKFKINSNNDDESEKAKIFKDLVKQIYKDECFIYRDSDNNEKKAIVKKRIKKVREILFEVFKDKIGFDNKEWKKFEGNAYSSIKCAGQDDFPNVSLDEAHKDFGHCGHCIVCKSFGFSKKDISWQGMLFFSDLEVLLFPVYTRLGTRWITTNERIGKGNAPSDIEKISTKAGDEGNLNLGWINLEVEKTHGITEPKLYEIDTSDIIIVHEDIFSQIVNSNLEVRTSVSIDPLTGAAKEGALFTSEAIPRGTVFNGCIRIFEKDAFAGWEQKIGELPSTKMIHQALIDSKKYYESLGIGGMTTRGFGRLKIELQNSVSQQTEESIQQNQQN